MKIQIIYECVCIFTVVPFPLLQILSKVSAILFSLFLVLFKYTISDLLLFFIFEKQLKMDWTPHVEIYAVKYKC